LWLHAKLGYDKLLAMMHDFATETSTAAVIRKELGMEPADFDRDFVATGTPRRARPSTDLTSGARSGRALAAWASRKR
jgi:hypothetical protein